MPLFSRSKSRSRQPAQTAGKLPLQPSYYVNTPSQTLVPELRENRKRSNSLVEPLAFIPGHGVYYGHPSQQYSQPAPRRDTPYMAGYSPQMMHHPAHYFSHGHVVYHQNPQKSGYDSSPQSHYLDSHARGRPRSNTSTAAREKLILSSGAPEVRVPLAGYAPAPSSHEGHKSGGIFGSIVNAVRSRSKSRERDALFSAGHAKQTASSYTPQGERGRPVYDLKRQKEMLRDVDAEIARRLEKDLRLQDLEDPYRPLRRDRSRSFESTRSRERTERRNRDIDPDVQDNTRYNAKALAYAPSPVTRMRSDQQQHHSSGYHTDAQPSMLRRSSTTAAHHPHHPKSSSHRSSQLPTPKGWFNSRGDQLVGRNSVIRQPPDREYLPCFARYPAPGQGFADSAGNAVDMEGRLVKRVG